MAAGWDTGVDVEAEAGLERPETPDSSREGERRLGQQVVVGSGGRQRGDEGGRGGREENEGRDGERVGLEVGGGERGGEESPRAGEEGEREGQEERAED